MCIKFIKIFMLGVILAFSTAIAYADEDAIAQSTTISIDAFEVGLQHYNSGNLLEAKEMFVNAANDDNPFAMNYLGKMYQYGEGVDVDFTTASEWYQLAAEAGLAIAKNYLADLYLHGQGVEKDEYKALKLYSEAAYQGEVLAQGNLGAMYLSGVLGEQDKITGCAWIYVSKNKNNIKSCKSLLSFKERMYAWNKGREINKELKN